MAGFWVRVLAVSVLAVGVSACVPVLLGGAVVGTTAVATDRRTAGMQVEDQSIELRVRNLVGPEFGDQVRVSPSSYNGVVLLLGSAPDEPTRQRIGQAVAGLENVKEVINQMELGLPRSVSTAANDSLITGQVRAALIGTPDLSSNALVISTYRNTVYLQGRVTQAEGDLAARVASGLRGVERVVTLYDIISPEEASQFVSTSGTPGHELPGTGVDVTRSTHQVPATPSLGGAAAGGAPGQSSEPALVIPIPVAN